MTARILEVYGGGMGGGAARYLAELLPALAGQGDEVRLLSLGRDNLTPDGVTVRRAGDLAGVLRSMREFRPDVVHTHGVRANLLGRIAARLQGTPAVTTVHSFLAQDYSSPLRASLALRLDDATLPWATRVIAISEALRQDLIARGARPEHVLVVPNGTPPPPAGDPGPLRALGEGHPVLAVAARLHPTKGVDVAIRAMRHLENVHLAVLGEGPARTELEALAEREGIRDRVHFLGFRADLRAIIAGADLALVPSRAEGFGLAALEAMAQGVPVIASRVGGLPELLTSGGGLLVAPDDPAALAGAARFALGDRDTLSAAARRTASRFSLEATAEQTRDVLLSAQRGA